MSPLTTPRVGRVAEKALVSPTTTPRVGRVALKVLVRRKALLSAMTAPVYVKKPDGTWVQPQHMP